MNELSTEEKARIDKLVRDLPKWKKHLRDFREKHPEMSPQEVMKKAGFTYRMKRGKLIKQFIRETIERCLTEA